MSRLCQYCGGEKTADESRPCFDCRYRMKTVSDGLRWAGLQPLDDAEIWKTSAVVAIIGGIEINHSHRCYRRVKGLVPVAVARELYADPAGRDLIRVNGHCGCPPPEEPWLVYRDDAGHEILTMKDKEETERFRGTKLWEAIERNLTNCIFVEDRSGYPTFIESYHIDGDLGLRVFVDIIKRHRLDQQHAAAEGAAA